MENFWKEKPHTENSRVKKDEKYIPGLLETQKQPGSHGCTYANLLVASDVYLRHCFWQPSLLYLQFPTTLTILQPCALQAVRGPNGAARG